MAWLWWMSFCTIETLKTNLQFSLHSAHPKDLIVKGERPSGAVQTGWRLNKNCHNSMLVTKTHQLLSMLSILESKKSIQNQAMNLGKNLCGKPSGFWPPRCRLPFFGSKAKLSPPNRGQLGSLGLFDFSLLSFDSHKCNKNDSKKNKKQLDLLICGSTWINSVWIYHLYDSYILYHRPYQLFHLSLFYIFLWYTTPETPGHPRSA